MNASLKSSGLREKTNFLCGKGVRTITFPRINRLCEEATCFCGSHTIGSNHSKDCLNISACVHTEERYIIPGVSEALLLLNETWFHPQLQRSCGVCAARPAGTNHRRPPPKPPMRKCKPLMMLQSALETACCMLVQSGAQSGTGIVFRGFPCE